MVLIKKDKMKKLFFSFGAALLLTSCGTTLSTISSRLGKSQSSLTNTKWTLADYVKGKTPTLNIENNKITGNAGCNNYFGSLSTDISTGQFITGDLGSTRMRCDNMAVEKSYLDMLEKANKYVVSESTLELYQDNLLLLKFNKAQ